MLCSEGEENEEVVSALNSYGFLDDQEEDDSDSDDEGGWVRGCDSVSTLSDFTPSQYSTGFY